MLHSLDRKNNTNANQEDPRTSSIISRILYLPDDLAWKILRLSILHSKDIPADIGTIDSFVFWPQWPAEGTSNDRDVEPDVFIRFRDLDVIIEAKGTDLSGQEPAKQWPNEVQAYVNQYGTTKKAILLALGGNGDNVDNKDIPVDSNYKVCCFRASWFKLREVVDALRLQNNDRNIATILDDISLACALFGFNTYTWFDEIAWNNYIDNSDFSYKNLTIL